MGSRSRVLRTFNLLTMLLLFAGLAPVATTQTSEPAANSPDLRPVAGVKKPKPRVVIIGLDGMMPEQVERYRNRIPEVDRFLTRGFFSPAIESPYTDTPTNWTTIATGAWVGTHGITSFDAHLPGMLLGDSTPTFNSRLAQAEYLWHAAERQGKRSILINYPIAFPKLLKNGVVIGGDGLTSRAWAVRHPDLITSFRRVPRGKPLVLGPAKDWKNVPPSYKVLREGVVVLSEQVRIEWGASGLVESGVIPATAERRYVLIFKDGDATKLLLSASRDAGKPIAVLARGDWSGWVKENFSGKDCLRQYKVLDLNADGTEVTIYGTIAATLMGWAYPAGLEQRIIANAGAYVEALELSPDQALSVGWFGPDVAKELMSIQAEWFAKTVAYLNRTEDWDLMMMHFHEPDGINHQELGKLDPSMGPEINSRADAFLGDTIAILFQMAAKIAQECDDGHTYVMVVSDHGNLPLTKIINVQGIMMREGWTSYAKNEKTGRWSLDPAHSVAAFENSGVWINLKGRELNGLVEPGPKYEELRTKIINRLQKVTDPETGKPVFSIVAKREDLEELGIWGERTEDVFAFNKPYYVAWSGPKSMTINIPEELMNTYRDSREVIPLATATAAGYYDRTLTADHWGLPTGTVGYASNRATFILTGPGIVPGGRAARVNLVDAAPTASHLLGIRPPEQCEGRIVWQALEK